MKNKLELINEINTFADNIDKIKTLSLNMESEYFSVRFDNADDEVMHMRLGFSQYRIFTKIINDYLLTLKSDMEHIKSMVEEI